VGATTLHDAHSVVGASGEGSGRWDSLEQQSLSLADSLLPIKYDRKNDLVTGYFFKQEKSSESQALLARHGECEFKTAADVSQRNLRRFYATCTVLVTRRTPILRKNDG